MVVVAAEVAVTEETLAAVTEAHATVAAIEETLADHAMAAVTEVHHPQVLVMVAVTKVQTHVMAEAEMHVLQEVTAFQEVIAEARAVTLLPKREAVQHHAKADTKEHVIAVIADHHALQEPIDQVHHALMQDARQKPLQETLTKKTNF